MSLSSLNTKLMGSVVEKSVKAIGEILYVSLKSHLTHSVEVRSPKEGAIGVWCENCQQFIVKGMKETS